MSDDYERALSEFERATRAEPEEIVALRRFLANRSSDQRVSVALLQALPPITDAETRRVRQGVKRRVRSRTWWAIGLGTAGGGALALAAAALLLLTLYWPTEISPTPLALTLAPSVESREPIAISESLRLSIAGNGTVGGTTSAPEIAWTQGTLTVDVDPGRGIALSVKTREATVRVMGTVFSVQRDALGTRVDVQRGRVHVACEAGSQQEIGPGETITCMPTTAAGLLARANTLKTTGAPPSEVLTAVDAGLPLASGPFRAELLALSAQMRLASGEPAAALVAAREYLTIGGPRRAEVLQIAAYAALQTEGCPGALPMLQALEDLGAGDPMALQRCEEGQ